LLSGNYRSRVSQVNSRLPSRTRSPEPLHRRHFRHDRPDFDRNRPAPLHPPHAANGRHQQCPAYPIAQTTAATVSHPIDSALTNATDPG
jgi:hypothetical protein